MGKSYWELTPDDFPPGEPVLKMKRGMYYRANNSGYTNEFSTAGLYERDEAIKYCFHEKDGKLKNGHCDVIAVPIRFAIEVAGHTTFDYDKRIANLEVFKKYAPVDDRTGVTVF